MEFSFQFVSGAWAVKPCSEIIACGRAFARRIMGGIISPEASKTMCSKAKPSFSMITSYLPFISGVTIIKWPSLLLFRALTGLPAASLISRMAPSMILPVSSRIWPTMVFGVVGGKGGAASGENWASCPEMGPY